jgi:co-chaperonin GroES (HSP10)
MVQPLADWVQLESFPDDCRNTPLNLDPRIIIPDNYKEPSRLAKVLAVGTGRMDGWQYKFSVAPGDTVLCLRYGGADAKSANGEKFFFMKEFEILAKVVTNGKNG